MTSTDGLLLEGIQKRFGSFLALDKTDLIVPKGTLMALLGPSGCGKTTTLRIIAGFEKPDAGRVIINGTDLVGLPPNRRGLGMVFQDYSLFPHMSVAENVAFGLKMANVPRAERDQRVRSMLELVRLDGYEDRLPAQLSGGQRQRVALARSIVTNPSVLLLDEPLAALDKNLRENMQFELRRLQRLLGITTVLVTHDQEEALTLSDQVAVMDKGNILQVGAPKYIYDAPATKFVAEFLGAMNFVAGIFKGLEAGRARIDASSRDTSTVTLYASPGAVVTSANVLVGVRPEKIVLSDSRPESGNALRATVTGCVFRGTYHAYELETDVGSDPFIVYQQAGAAPRVHAVGASVWLSWQMEDSLLFEAEQGA